MSQSDERSGTDRASDAAGAETILQLVNLCLRERKILVSLPLVLAVLVVLFTLLQARDFTASATFVPQSTEQTVGGLADVASTFGFDIPSIGGGQSPEFYVELLDSRNILKQTVQHRYPIPESSEIEGTSRKATLVEIFDIAGDSAALRVEHAIDQLRSRLDVRVVPDPGIVELEVTTGSPGLSKAIGARLLDLVHEFNVQTRQTQASAEREFTGRRLETARADLRAAEDSLEAFLERNRRYQNSPKLRFEHDRLRRRVDLQQQVVTSLAQSFEQAKINEVRDTPLISIVDPPESPARPDSRLLIFKAVLALVLGGTIAVSWILVRDRRRQLEVESREVYLEYERLKDQLADEIASSLRSVAARVRFVRDSTPKS